MKKTLICLFIVLSTFNFASAREYAVIGFACSDWKVLSENGADLSLLAKTSFLRGIYEGLNLGVSPHLDQFYHDTSYKNLLEGVNHFCSDYRNDKIPIVFALRIISLEMTGIDHEIIDKHTRKVRKTFSSM